jgi:hypothetical protein
MSKRQGRPLPDSGAFFVAIVRPRGYDALARPIFTPWELVVSHLTNLNWPRLPMLGAFFVGLPLKETRDPVIVVTLPHADAR